MSVGMRKSISLLSTSLFLSIVAIASPVKSAQDPPTPALAEMIANAAASGDVETLKTVLLLTLQTEPGAGEALVRRALLGMPGEEKAILAAVAEAQPQLAERIILPGQNTVPQRLEDIAAEEAAQPLPSFFDFSSWTGEASIGGSIISGNTEEQAMTAALQLDRAVGDWEHSFGILGDYSRNQGATTKKLLNANYAARWFLWERGYIFGLVDFELDQFQQFEWRLSEAVGVGYRIFDTERMTWKVEGGPGARQTQFDVGGLENEFIFTLGSIYRYRIREGLRFTNDTRLFIGSDRTTLTNLAALTAQLTARLSGRFSFETQYDTPVPLGQKSVQTATRASIVYGF